MIRLIVVDIDGILIENRNGFLNRCRPVEMALFKMMPSLKRKVISISEVLERGLHIKHSVNNTLINRLSKIRSNYNPRIMLFTDRGHRGLLNVWEELGGLNLSGMDAIRIWGKKEERQNKAAFQKRLGTAAEILIDTYAKPNAKVLLTVRRWANTDGRAIKANEILVIDDDPDFLKTAKSEGFATGGNVDDFANTLCNVFTRE